MRKIWLYLFPSSTLRSQQSQHPPDVMQVRQGGPIHKRAYEMNVAMCHWLTAHEHAAVLFVWALGTSSYLDQTCASGAYSGPRSHGRLRRQLRA
jgi:hypothetical protein